MILEKKQVLKSYVPLIISNLHAHYVSPSSLQAFSMSTRFFFIISVTTFFHRSLTLPKQMVGLPFASQAN